jgi:hypothetical protein
MTPMVESQFAVTGSSKAPIRKKVSPYYFRRFILGIGFAVLLALPALDQLVGLSASFKSTEKRILTPFPTLHFPHLLTYIQDFNQYYKENFGWRNALFYQYSYWKYKVLETSPLPDKVVIGKHGWFYPGNSLAQVADQHKGQQPIGQNTLQLIAKTLTRYQEQLAKQGARLYVIIAPDSYTIYPENLPDYFKGDSNSSNFDYLKQYLAQQTTIPLIDVRDSLRSAKSKHVVYCQTDTHWNNYGSLIASMALVSRIRQDFPGMPSPKTSDYSIQPVKGDGGDLVTMLALNREYTDSINYKVQPAPYLKSQEVETISQSHSLPKQRFITAKKDLPKLLFTGDSFSYSMNTFVPNYFSESYIVRDGHLDMKVVNKEKPDVVVVEIVERNINLLSQL